MDFGLSDEQRALLDSIDRMMAQHLPPEEVRRRDKAHEPPDFMLKHYADLGLLAIPFPESYGGLGGEWQTVVLAEERLGYHAAMAASLLQRSRTMSVLSESCSSAFCTCCAAVCTVPF